MEIKEPIILFGIFTLSFVITEVWCYSIGIGGFII